MGANYKMMRNPPTAENEEQPFLHPRVVSKGTIGIKELMEGAKRSTFSAADMKGALQLLSDLMAEQLSLGYNVELEGIGFFSVALQSRAVMDKKELRSESVHFRDVNFRCSKDLKAKLKSMSLSRAKESNHEPYPQQEREHRLMLYFEQRDPYISRRTYMGLCLCSKTCALADLQRLVKEGKLIQAGSKNTTIYLKPIKKEG